MKHATRMPKAGLVLGAWLGIASLLGFAAPAAYAADLPVEPLPSVAAPSSGWRFQLTGYSWATGLDGDIGVRNLPTVKVSEDFIDILKNLNAAFMGSLFAQNDQWLIALDLIWSKLSQDAVVNPLDRQHPALAAITTGTQVKMEMKQTIASGLVGYKLPAFIPDLDLFVTAGVRYQRLLVDVKALPTLLPLTINKSGLQQWADPVVGFFAHYKITDRWFINAIADVGGFSVGSQFTTQGFASVGYMWTPSLSTALGYRVIYTDYRSNSFKYNVVQQGLFASVAYHF